MTLDPLNPMDRLYLELIPQRLSPPWSMTTCINTPAAQYARRMVLVAALEPLPLVDEVA